jgi:serine/threonine-protein kinase
VSDSATVDHRSGSSGGTPSTGPRRFGRYVVLSTIGSGAMGEVLRARDERLGREVAIKTVRNVLGLSAESFHQRFEAEARALAALSHPAIVQVHDLGFEPPPDGEPYLVMELVDGESLKERLARGPLLAQEARGLGVQLARALEAAHRRGILHRDVKPANILCTASGQWKLADFGVAHVPDSSMTITGQFLGTPAYAAPEALALGQFSEQSDVFSAAITLVEALSGEKLRGNATLSEMVRRSADAIELPPSVPPDLAAALRPALAFDAASRPTAAQLAQSLAGSPETMAPRLPPPPPLIVATRPSSKLWIAGAIAGGVLAIGLIAALAARGGDEDDPAAPPAQVTRTPAATPADATPVAPLEDEEEEDVEELPRARLDEKGAKDWRKIADQVRKGHYGEALDKLDEFEEKYGRSAESHHLRLQLENALRGMRGDD